MKPKMSQYGATLQTFNHELVKCLEQLKNQRREIVSVVNKEELERKAVEKEIRALQSKLSKIDNSLQKHKQLQENYDKAILDAELGFQKILETSHVLLNVTQQEAAKLQSTNNETCHKPSYDGSPQNSIHYE